MSSAKATGVSWIIILLIYFTCMSLIVSLVSFAGGGAFYSRLDLPEPAQCDGPRTLYSSYEKHSEAKSITTNWKGQFTSSDTDYFGENSRGLAHLDCSQTYGVTSESACLMIEGCSWDAVPLSLWERFYSWINPYVDPSTPIETCIGDINHTYYNITARSYLFGANRVNAHENSRLGSVGSICTHPNVIYDEDLCELFSCTWTEKMYIAELDVDDIDMNAGIISKMWNTMKEMFMFRFEFGTDDIFINYFLNFFIFWLPLIALMGAIYLTLPFI